MYADKVLLNGKVFSPAGDTVIRAEAVAISGDKIIAVGTNESITELINEGTDIVDCKGKSILPGLCDAHCHPSWMASMLESCQLFDIKPSPENTCSQVTRMYTDRVAEFAAEKNDDLIRGIGWNRAFFIGSCADTSWPTRHDLDKISQDKPVVMESYCQHILWVNTKALELAGITKDTKDPDNGAILREDDGTPSGILMEMEAIDLIKENLPGYDFTVEQYKRSFLAYQEEMLSYGVTLVNDCLCTENAKTAYRELAAEGALKLRLRGVYHLPDCSNPEIIKDFAKQRASDKIGEFEIDTVKIFLEGDMAMLEPYEDAFNNEHGNPKGYKSMPFFSLESAKTAMKVALENGFNIHIHAMGDASVKQAVDALIYAQNATNTDSRNIIAHLMAVDPADITKMGENRIIANCQPRWMIYDSDADENYMIMYGKDRTLGFYPNRQFLDAGCVVAYGTDFPVTPPANTMHNIQCAVTRSVFEADEAEYVRYKGTILGPEDDPTRDCVSLEDAVRSNSWSGAFQNHLEDVTGSLEPGKSADLILLDCDIEKTPAEDLHRVKVEQTIFKGKVVYKRV